MKLNCKPGDIAQYVGCKEKGCTVCPQLIGHVMQVIECDPFASFVYGEHTWKVDPPQSVPTHGEMMAVPDEVLRPIRGREGQDETLKWKEVPKVANKQHTT